MAFSSIHNQNPFVVPTVVLTLILLIRYIFSSTVSLSLPQLSTIPQTSLSYCRHVCGLIGWRTLMALTAATAVCALLIPVFEWYFFVFECAVSQRYFDESLLLAQTSFAVMQSAGIVFWLDYASMLNAIRRQSINPWDHDIDISIVHPDFLQEKSVYPYGAFSNAVMNRRVDSSLTPSIRGLIKTFTDHGISTYWDGSRHLLQLRLTPSSQPHIDVWLWSPERTVDGRDIVYWSADHTINYNGRAADFIFPIENTTWLDVKVGMAQSAHDIARLEFGKYGGSYLIPAHFRGDCFHNFFNGRWMY